MSASDVAQRLILDGTKLPWHLDRVRAWERGERIAPITIDMALTQHCSYACTWCYAQLQRQETHYPITTEVIERFLDDCAEVGVKAISLVSDGESTLNKAFVPTIKMGHARGISMASGTNARVMDRDRIEEILPCLTYLRVNFSAGERVAYAAIMGCKESDYDRVVENISDMVLVKHRDNLPVTLGMQMVCRPQDSMQILPLARLAIKLGVDYLVVKHTSDGVDGELGINYDEYEKIFPVLEQAEKMSTERTKIVVKWSKIKTGRNRSYDSCYGPPFLLQISGSGRVASCGMMFADKFSDYHMGDIVTERFRDIVKSERYWGVIRKLASPTFRARDTCGSLCLQHKVNEALDNHKKGLVTLDQPQGPPPQHINFI